MTWALLLCSCTLAPFESSSGGYASWSCASVLRVPTLVAEVVHVVAKAHCLGLCHRQRAQVAVPLNKPKPLEDLSPVFLARLPRSELLEPLLQHRTPLGSLALDVPVQRRQLVQLEAVAQLEQRVVAAQRVRPLRGASLARVPQQVQQLHVERILLDTMDGLAKHRGVL
eukprot:CAMPEP_0182815242 /NCGR_PEP_ID=MMETSP0006_2-20121128/10286_1 /TAXON_ID=97485 /ORGANISM="Prymnesium parvum, Strain Texoma1" /LENGTH=168 /DNA_ID=CAMNT_0024941427 /DNA_START=276 /DNA_END=779 /DNA_ORIENTATION=-